MEETFRVICPTCHRNNEVVLRVRENSFNEWEPIHCAWCGLQIDEIRSAEMPKTKIIADADISCD